MHLTAARVAKTPHLLACCVAIPLVQKHLGQVAPGYALGDAVFATQKCDCVTIVLLRVVTVWDRTVLQQEHCQLESNYIAVVLVIVLLL